MSPRTPPDGWQPQSFLAKVASRREVHAAFQFFHLREPMFRTWHERLVQIAAPPFGEEVRAAEMLSLFRRLGFDSADQDKDGNVIATLHGQDATLPSIALCAHIDTVFSAETPLLLQRDGDRIMVPGASDNGAGLTAMLALAAACKSERIAPPCDVLFVGTVGEEGDGNLRGARALFASQLGKRIGAAIAIDGAGVSAVVNQALGSRRYAIEITGPGGHSWNDSDRPNPIACLAQAIAAFQQQPPPVEPATTINFATIEGGTSINSVPDRVECKVDIRSLSSDELVRQEVRLHRAVEDAVMAANAQGKHRLGQAIRTIGNRPSGTLPEGSVLAELVRVVDRHLQIRARYRAASTDANIPLSLGIPAISVGGGGTGGNAHTLDEWFDPTGRDLALRRILLLVLALAESHAAEAPAGPRP